MQVYSIRDSWCFGLQSTWLCQLGSLRLTWHVCSSVRVLSQGLYYSNHHYLQATHFSNFIGFLSNGGYSLRSLSLPLKSCILVFHHISVWKLSSLRSSSHFAIILFRQLVRPLHYSPFRFTLVWYCSSKGLELSLFHHSFVSNIKYLPKASWNPSVPVCFNSLQRLLQRLWFVLLNDYGA